MDIKKVAVIGGGTMGNGITHVFAMNGILVNLVETNQDLADKALSTIEKNLDRMVKKEKISAADKDQVLSRITPVTDLEPASQCDLTVEAVVEKMEEDIGGRVA